MRTKKIRSIKRASFFGMFKGGLTFLLINFIILSFFAVTMVYLFMCSQEQNISKVLINDLTEKYERLYSTSRTLASIMARDSSKDEKNFYLERAFGDSKDIQGVLILDKNGIISGATSNYKEFIGIDSSGENYYNKVIQSQSSDTFLTDSYVSFKTKQVTLNIISPIVVNNNITGMVVLIINPNIIQNKALDGIEDYLVDTEGDIIFQSNEGNVISREDNIKDTLIMKQGIGKTKSMFYKDKVSGNYVLGNIGKEPITSMYILVQHNILSDRGLVQGLTLALLLITLLILIYVFAFSMEISNSITVYVNMFKNQLKRISAGDYEINITNQYPYEEINEIIDSFTQMASKIKLREEELQAYNEELVAANDEIKSIISTLGKSEKERKEQYLQIIWTMVNLLEIKDEYTAGHSKSVTYYAEEIAGRLNRDYGFNINMESIQVAAILHDIGKIGIDGEILNKPSKLTKEEYEVIKTHPVKGYYALKSIESLKEERKVIKYHHERYDGQGYPEGIKGDSIPLGARIICVADAFDAMVSDRPYRKGLPIEKVVEELIKNKGIQFDPLIVDIFVSMLFEGEVDAQNENIG